MSSTDPRLHLHGTSGICNTDCTKPPTLQSVRPYAEGRWRPDSSKEINKSYGSWLGLVLLRATVFLNALQAEAGVENCRRKKFVWMLRISFVRRGTETHTATFCSPTCPSVNETFELTSLSQNTIPQFCMIFLVPLFFRNAANPYSAVIRCKVQCEVLLTKWTVNRNVRTLKNVCQ